MRSEALLVSLTALAACGFGCASIPPGGAAIDAVSVQGTHAVSGSDVEDKIASAESPKFLGVLRGVVYDYELYDRNVLQRDLDRVERFYRSKGYYEARVRAGRVRHKNATHVEVTIEVDEGEPVRIRDVELDGMEAVTAEEWRLIHIETGRILKKGDKFEEDAFTKSENQIKRMLTDRGYAWATVKRKADVDLPGHYANLTFDIRLGPKSKFGAIRVDGLGELPEAPVRRALDIKPGEDYSTEKTSAANNAILGLGTFSSVELIPQLTEPPPADGVVPLTVKVSPQKLKTVILGGGLELDAIRTEIHAHVGWEHRNLFGGFRRFSVDFKPGLDLYPTRLPDFQKPTDVLPAEKLALELRQPGFIEARTNGVIHSEVNAYPVLLTTDVDPKAPVIGYLEYRGWVGLDRTLWKLFGAATYNFQYNAPFAYKGDLDKDLSGIALSFIDFQTHLDLRNDPVNPHSGLYVQNDLQVAGLGGDARDIRIQPEVRGYVPLGRKVTLAARATVGFLFPFSYGDSLGDISGDSKQSRKDQIRDIELVYLRGFFSGGPSSNRGYPLRGIGPRGAVPFFNPGLQAQALAQSCDVSNPKYDAARCAVSLGGLSLWEASLEVRFPIVGPLGGVTFCDASDVSQDRFTVRLDYPHLSCGLGLRYATPIGPVRLDVGYRIPGVQVPKSVDPRLDDDPGTLYGVPIAFAFGIGESF